MWRIYVAPAESEENNRRNIKESAVFKPKNQNYNQIKRNSSFKLENLNLNKMHKKR